MVLEQIVVVDHIVEVEAVVVQVDLLQMDGTEVLDLLLT
jgi:hypothetical protein